jgi:transcriptional regulator with XRE-family HTH domain
MFALQLHTNMYKEKFDTKRLPNGGIKAIAEQTESSISYVSQILNGKREKNTTLAKVIIELAENMANEYEQRLKQQIPQL